MVFSWITYASKADRDRINAEVMTDPRLQDQMNKNVFDTKRMIYGGFESFLALEKP